MNVKNFFSSRRPVAALVIAMLSAAVAIAVDQMPVTSLGMQFADNVFYDWFYRYRPVESQRNGDVVIVAVDDKSLGEVDRGLEFGWPWPRIVWYMVAKYMQDAGARVVAFDILMSERVASGAETDETIGERMDETTIPMAFARVVQKDGQWGRFAPKISRPVEFGGTDVTTEKVYRDFIPQRSDKPSLALATLRAAGIEPKLPVDRPFLLHYYGPHRDNDDKPTFPTWSASRVITAVTDPEARNSGITPEDFKGKIVIVGVVADGQHDIKSAPNSPRMPGVEIQATAIANMLRGQSARHVPSGVASIVAVMCSFLTAVGTVAIRSAGAKSGTVLCVTVGIVLTSYLLFSGKTINWLPPSMALLAVVIAAIGGISWSYFLEDRQARMLLKALETCLSPSVAAELAANPRKLAVGGRQLEMTVMFTDLAGFTALTEELKEKIEPALNYYLGEMSEQILQRDGTLDKYIGDAIMTFWNAPLSQPDHALRACEAALAIQRREREIREPMAALGMKNTITRIGINSGSMFVGFTGSQRKLNYTVLGDSVNLAARLEPANKLYNTQICVAENTVVQVKDRFLFRKVDLLTVKGKTQPMAVYELMGDESMRNTEFGILARRFDEAFELYLARNWDAADSILLELKQRFPDDGPIKTLRERIAEFKLAPPPMDWNGAYVAKSK